MHWKMQDGLIIYQPMAERVGTAVGEVRWIDVEGYVFKPYNYELTALDLTHIARVLNSETIKRNT